MVLLCSKLDDIDEGKRRMEEVSKARLGIATVFQHLKDIETANDATQLHPLDDAQRALDSLTSPSEVSI